ncbi:MAG: ribosomal protein S18-alanine N-acetyltransferase [Desulfomonile sp.]|jgi:ribosomal-protein-alanine N-acetyltransferase
MGESPGFQIMRMLPEHIDEIMDIERSSYGTPWSRNMFLEEMSNRIARQLVFTVGDRIIGYVCFWEVLDESHVLNIAVHPDLRRQSHGKAIMDVLERMCRSDGLKRIVLDVGRRNLAARNLYKKSGFNVIGFRKNYYTEIKDDALIMQKQLDYPSISNSPGKREIM